MHVVDTVHNTYITSTSNIRTYKAVACLVWFCFCQQESYVLYASFDGVVYCLVYLLTTMREREREGASARKGQSGPAQREIKEELPALLACDRMRR